MADPSQAAVWRFGVAPAPDGLRLMQDLVNTSLAARAGDHSLDQLADLDAAKGWLGQALDDWTSATGRTRPTIALERRDLSPLKEFRDQLRASLRADANNAHAVHSDQGNRMPGDGVIKLTVATDGRVAYAPVGSGWRAVTAMVSIEMLLAQANGKWARLKTCANPPCGAAFFDKSPNVARVWHDTKTCGNVTNLRASRARRNPC